MLRPCCAEARPPSTTARGSQQGSQLTFELTGRKNWLAFFQAVVALGSVSEGSLALLQRGPRVAVLASGNNPRGLYCAYLFTGWHRQNF